MSTNDTLLILANGRAKNREILPGNFRIQKFCALLDSLLLALAKKTVADGEGVTKVVQVVVEGARTSRRRKKSSGGGQLPLVKTAFFGEDANWGRIYAPPGIREPP